MSGKLDFLTENSFDSVAEGARKLEVFAEESGLPPRKAYQLDLIYEELMTNVVKYSYSDGVSHQIQVSLEDINGTLVFTIVHDGVDFNPWVQPDPDLNVPLEERGIGGVGIMLVRKFSLSANYERIDGKSIISVRI